eukprot:scaffold338_cov361-Pavlova_lutheri.AAC.28
MKRTSTLSSSTFRSVHLCMHMGTRRSWRYSGDCASISPSYEKARLLKSHDIPPQHRSFVR